MSTYIVDFEGVNDIENKKFLFQEFAYFCINEKIIQNHFLKIPDYTQTGSTQIILRNLNHIPKDFGQTKFKVIFEFLNQPNCIFYVKGLQKCKFLKKITNQLVINLEDYGCPKLESLPSTKNEYQCTLINHK